MKTLSSIIKRPRITEKASMKAESNVYAFEVSTDANKKTVAAAVKALYNVTPVKVAIVKIPAKTVFVRGKMGTKAGGKKAYVYLKKGETIEFV
jgi:large subunit ribosomal protein L23